ncbi:putative rRNA biogenesis protein RRP36 [Elsinoe fawcettii]|nr:putative rRNA biogenesis protein RRP36 [Elsinoe fawcettii]
MPGHKKLDKVVRPSAEDVRGDGSEDESQDQDGLEGFEEGGSSPSILDTGDGGNVLSSGDEDASDVDEAGSSEPEEQLKNVSFGTLAKAQDSLSRKRKRGSDATAQQDTKLDALRARLEEIRRAKGTDSKKSSKKVKSEAKPDKIKDRKQDKKQDSDQSEDRSGSDESEDDSEDEGPSKARSSKHAPTSQSSKWQVTRKRTVIDAPKRHTRDPRFDLPGPIDNSRMEKAYSFLHDYEDKEMDELRVAIKKTRDEDAKQTLRRKLMSMQNRKKSRLDKERQQSVLREHRKKEKEAIEQGKQPFYLKRSELKKQTLVSKFEGMKSKDREKAIERRRKKDSQKEKKSMPAPRRITG